GLPVSAYCLRRSTTSAQVRLIEPRSSAVTDAGQFAWRNVRLVWASSAGLISQSTVVSPQLGKSGSAVHLTRLPGTSSSTRIRCVGPPKPKLAIAPSLDCALVSDVQKLANPSSVDTAL